MSKVLITGGAGFLGKRLAKKLLERGELTGASGQPEKIDQIILLDMVAPTDLDDPRIKVVTGDIADAALLRQVIDTSVTSVFHLAAVVSGAAEADFDLGMRINLDATRELLELCRKLGHKPRFIFTSSVAVFGGKLPAVVQDDTAPTPMSSYGAQKVSGELMVSDYSRKGFIDGRTLRMPTISVRPGKPNAAASSFASGIVREPLNGESAVAPVSPDTKMWLMSPRYAIENLIHGHELSGDTIGFPRTISLPGLSVSVKAMVDALREVAGDKVADLVKWEPNEAVKKIVESWPGEFAATRAKSFGFLADNNYADVIRAYQEDDMPK